MLLLLGLDFDVCDVFAAFAVAKPTSSATAAACDGGAAAVGSGSLLDGTLTPWLKDLPFGGAGSEDGGGAPSPGCALLPP